VVLVGTVNVNLKVGADPERTTKIGEWLPLMATIVPSVVMFTPTEAPGRT